MTYTYALLEVLPSTYADVRKRLEQAGCSHAFHEDRIDMHGLALVALALPTLTDEELHARIVRGDYKSPDSEALKRDALQHVHLTGHPKADEIYSFAVKVGEQGGPLLIVHVLEQIAAFIQ